MLNRTLTIPAVLTALLSLVFIAPCTGAAAAAAAEGEMTSQQAAEHFLGLVCDYNDAVDVMTRRVYGPDNKISQAEARRRLPEIKRATVPYARAHYVFARGMLNPPAAWPASVADPADRTASGLIRMTNLLRRAIGAISGAQWIRLTNRAHSIPVPTATIRARLALPPPGEGC